MALINGTGLNDTLIGTIDGDEINGLGGNDILIGGGGEDRLNGGAGFDTLTGGADRDLFLFTYAEMQGDIITDLMPEDLIRFDLQALAGLADGPTFIDTVAFSGTAGQDTLFARQWPDHGRD